MKPNLLMRAAAASTLTLAGEALAAGPPAGVPLGPPSFVTLGPPSFVTAGPPPGVTLGPPSFVTAGPPAGVTLGPPASVTLGPPAGIPPAAALPHIPTGVPLGKPIDPTSIGPTVRDSARAASVAVDHANADAIANANEHSVLSQ